MSDITHVTEQPLVAQGDSASVMEIISRAANDPNTNMEKLEKLFDLYERITARSGETVFNAAMSEAQAEMEPVRKDATSDKGKYSSYVALDRAMRPIYTKHGFGLSFDTGDATKPDDIRIFCYVTHAGGGKRTYHVDMPADGKGAKGGDVMTRTHATGSAMTYGQRYLLKMVFNIAVGADDDGKGAGGNADPREGSAAYQAAMGALNACNTLADLKAWKANAEKMEASMPVPEWNLLVRTCNDRTQKMKEAAA